ncbi:hypothetical protein NG798_07535 [Ancylothrix sp. C2]|uniref:hypothetical protein n=1 Tax=Ancylothrix sp. D3o TaxID=2953691 RepID=UPI0021BA7D3E|nr:hypothetical protein [Ancylothrix sp. D3o]MCT7949635.1 hypothetical protein [Ancylothrix sp. D3o]
METLQTQVSTLTHKVDALYQVVEQLNSKISEAITDGEVSAKATLKSVLNENGGHYSSHSLLDIAFEHKDVLSDSNYPERNGLNSEQNIAPETQIQRLTAQLTAAYNRIAALEEQLLARRIHS